MFNTLPKHALDVMDWTWEQFRPYADELTARPLTADNVHQWLTDWSHLAKLLSEIGSRRYLATTLNTADEAARDRFVAFLENINVPSEEADQRLKEAFLASGLEPKGFEIPLRNMRAEAALFREQNLPLFTDHEKLGLVYDEILGGQTTVWAGEEVTSPALVPLVKDADRATRETAWRQMSGRVLADRQAINENWVKLMEVRRQIAANAGKANYRDYAWDEKLRFDYTPDDARTFHAAILEAVVPATARVYERRRARMGVDSLRPWDVGVDVMRNTDFTGDALGRPPIQPFADVADLEEKGSSVFRQVDSTLAGYYETMRREQLMDLPNYKGKAPGAFCTGFPTLERPFVFMNAVGSSHDVRTFLHEFGHAFHEFESSILPYHQQQNYPMEFAEVASMSMELLASPYLLRSEGGFYSPDEAARVMVEQLEGMLVFWPYMAVVDSFNHWAHTHEEGIDPAACDAQWSDLWDQYIVGQDWRGLDDQKATGWHRKLHIHRIPFYYIEYGLASLGAAQVWRNALTDQAGAVASYRRALALGYSVPLPELYRAAGANFAFDAGTLGEIVTLIESTLDRLDVGAVPA